MNIKLLPTITTHTQKMKIWNKILELKLNEKRNFFFIVLILTSCVYNHTAKTEDLGNGYFYLGDGNESQILLNKNRKKNKSIGLIVTGSEIVKYNYDDKYIIAKSLREKNELYWIIDKELPIDSVNPLTETEYKTELKTRGITLTLKKRE